MKYQHDEFNYTRTKIKKLIIHNYLSNVIQSTIISD